MPFFKPVSGIYKGRGPTFINIWIQDNYVTTELYPVSLACYLDVNVASFVPRFWYHGWDQRVDSSERLGACNKSWFSDCDVILKRKKLSWKKTGKWFVNVVKYHVLSALGSATEQNRESLAIFFICVPNDKHILFLT